MMKLSVTYGKSQCLFQQILKLATTAMEVEIEKFDLLFILNSQTFIQCDLSNYLKYL